MLIGDGYAIKGNIEGVKGDKKVLKLDGDELKSDGDVWRRESATESLPCDGLMATH